MILQFWPTKRTENSFIRDDRVQGYLANKNSMYSSFKIKFLKNVQAGDTVTFIFKNSGG